LSRSPTDARELWSPAGVYLNTASYGLPPRPGWEALQAALEDWRGGRTSWEAWGESAEAARASWARLVGVAAGTVAIGATVSGLVGAVAASIPDGARVLGCDVEFASLLFPFLVQERRGIEVRLVAPGELAEAIEESTDVVAFSAVQMSTGEVADVAGIAAAARAHGGTPGRTFTRATSARRCGSRRAPAASTPRRPGSPGWAPRRRSR